jgi:DNA-binding HxlR family transcriptional regulator
MTQLVQWTRPGPSETERPASAQKTPVEVALEALEGPFRALIVWHLFWGARPFSELMRLTNGITKKQLRWELSELEKLGLVRKEVRVGGGRKADYSLTGHGQTLKPLVASMYEWGLLRMRSRARTA